MKVALKNNRTELRTSAAARNHSATHPSFVPVRSGRHPAPSADPPSMAPSKAEEEAAAATPCGPIEARGGDDVARWLPLVRRLATHVLAAAPSEETLEDIEGDGYEALLRALESFDPSKGGTIEGWIALKVRGAMIDGMRRHSPGPFRRRERRERLGSVEFVSLDAPIRAADSDAQLTLAEALPDREAVPVAEVVEEREQLAAKRKRLRVALAKLTYRERRIMVMRHVEEMSVAEVAKRECLSKSSIFKIERDVRIKASGIDCPPPGDFYGLSERELEVLEHTATGASAPETAQRLRRSTETIKSHRKTAIAKLKARNMHHAIAKAYRLGILR
jgi:RNA polymerase sigma factor (sigma-70 family)